MLRSANDAHPDGVANSSGLVGRRYMAHLATMMEAIDPFRENDTAFQKTVAINDFYLRGPRSDYPLGQIQSQGRTHGLMAKLHAPWWGRWIPLPIYDWWVGRGFDWLLMSEDLPHEENRVTLDRAGRIVLSYRQSNIRAHDELIAEAKRILARLGLRFPVTHSLGTSNTTHQCGTMVFGADPRTSVLDTYCRTHDVDNLFVVDASFFPSSAAVNPGLTIIAQALRVADHIKDTHL
jgi:choline dehydrogenase-like flavoprotein